MILPEKTSINTHVPATLRGYTTKQMVEMYNQGVEDAALRCNSWGDGQREAKLATAIRELKVQYD